MKAARLKRHGQMNWCDERPVLKMCLCYGEKKKKKASLTVSRNGHMGVEVRW